MVFNYVYRFGLQLWRRKTSVLIASALLLIITAGLNYNRNDLNIQLTLSKDDKSNYGSNGKGEGVHFVGQNEKRKYQPSASTELDVEALRKIEQPSRDDIANRLDDEINDPNVIREIEQQMGIPYVSLDVKNPYIPKQRLVHFDLKGAPPKVSYIKRVLPLVKTMGATGILIG